MRTVAIPFIREGYLNFWKIVKMDDALYSKAVWTNHNIVRLDGRTSEQADAILKSERTRLLKERWDIAKAKASIRIFNSEKQFWKDLSVARLKQGTMVL